MRRSELPVSARGDQGLWGAREIGRPVQLSTIGHILPLGRGAKNRRDGLAVRRSCSKYLWSLSILRCREVEARERTASTR